MLKVRARDAEHLGQFLRQQIGAVANVVSTRTTIVLETVKEDPRITIPKELTLKLEPK
jgi:Lrp/AsnC family leucine-responsive transcriptional regulator